VVSWLLLRGKCRDCGARISIRYPVVELLTGLLFALLVVRFGPSWVLPAYLYLAAVGVALAAIDLDTKRLPDRLTLPSYPVAVVLLGVAALAGDSAGDLVRALLGMLALGGAYFLLAFIYPAGMGLGDVKLAGVLGLYLAFLSWGALVVGFAAGFLLGGFYAVTLLLAGRAGRKTGIPFGPFMIAGAFVAVFFGAPLAGAYNSAWGL
jgi:leader peptidase (prepilin peptidase)/N-methyltransferase